MLLLFENGTSKTNPKAEDTRQCAHASVRARVCETRAPMYIGVSELISCVQLSENLD